MTEFDLPVTECLPDLLAALAEGRNALLVAPPGAGKTSLVPPALLAAPWRGDGVILVTEPRRLAARAAAMRMASQRGEAVGATVGFRTRTEQAVSAATRIEIVTTGLLVRRLIGDPGMGGVAALVLDEVHERSLEADLALGFALQTQALLRPDLRLVAMSATPDIAALQPLLGGAVVRSEGRAFPIAIRHTARDLADRRDLPQAIARAVRAALERGALEGGAEATPNGTILCFLPGMTEIRRTEAALAGIGAEILLLHGALPADQQLRALRADPGPRVVLASSIAETSLTVPGVRMVIDGGWRRAPVLDAATGLTRLATTRISRAGATQRAGRAGREGPGVALRLWREATERTLAAADRPEIAAADLSGFVLDCLAFGVEPEALALAEAPPAGALAAARRLLETLGAMEHGRLSGLGRAMAGMGAAPRLAAMMLGAQSPAEQALAADLAAILEERDPFRRGHAGTAATASIGARVRALAGEAALSEPAELDRAALAEVRRTARDYRRRLKLGEQPADPDRAGHVLAMGFPDRIAEGRGEGRFRLAGGGGASLERADPLAGTRFLVAAAIEIGTSARIVLAAPLDPADLPASMQGAIQTRVEVTIDPVSGVVLARRRVRLGALILSDRTEPADAALRADLLCARAAEAPGALAWDERGRQLRARIGWMRTIEPEAWPDPSDAGLAARVEEWLRPGLGTARSLAEIDPGACLRAWLGGAALHRLDAALPEAIGLPGGRAAVDYTLPVPQAAARAQAFYGLHETPKLAGGRIRLRLALLSPAGRPIAVTADLGGFWGGGWAEARREMRGRYPRHDWPERP